MSDEDQERFEDYLDLERYIEELQAGHVAHPPRDLTPAQARIYRMAALFRSATPEAAAPRPEFVEELRARLLAMDQEDMEEDEEDTVKQPVVSKSAQQLPAPAQEIPPQEAPPEQPQQPTAPPAPVQPRRAHFVSRRSLLSGGAVAAASLAAGIGIGSVIERPEENKGSKASTTAYPPSASAEIMPLVPDDITTTWNYAGTLAQLGDNALRFVTDSVVGYIMRSDKGGNWDGAGAGEVIAFSAACTHMGCIVQWQKDGLFHCPCHGGMFDAYGEPVNATGHLKYMTALPRLETKIVNGKIYVRVPKSST